MLQKNDSLWCAAGTGVKLTVMKPASPLAGPSLTDRRGQLVISDSSRDGGSNRTDVWAEVRGKTYHGIYSVADGWVEVIADNGLTKSARIGDSTAEKVAERLLYELHARHSGAVDD